MITHVPVNPILGNPDTDFKDADRRVSFTYSGPELDKIEDDIAAVVVWCEENVAAKLRNGEHITVSQTVRGNPFDELDEKTGQLTVCRRPNGETGVAYVLANNAGQEEYFALSQEEDGTPLPRDVADAAVGLLHMWAGFKSKLSSTAGWAKFMRNYVKDFKA